MTESARLDALVKIRDGIIELIDMFRPKGISDDIPDPAMVMWRDALGEHGAYKLADLQNNPDNPGFKRLQTYLRQHDGKATIQGEFYWLFKDDVAVGRKIRMVFVG